MERLPGPRFWVEPSPAGGYYVRLAAHDAPVSRHDTEEEAVERCEAYRRGSAREAVRGDPGERVHGRAEARTAGSGA